MRHQPINHLNSSFEQITTVRTFYRLIHRTSSCPVCIFEESGTIIAGPSVSFTGNLILYSQPDVVFGVWRVSLVTFYDCKPTLDLVVVSGIGKVNGILVFNASRSHTFFGFFSVGIVVSKVLVIESSRTRLKTRLFCITIFANKVRNIHAF